MTHSTSRQEGLGVRLPPNADRMAISRSRSRTRTSIRFATFPHAMRRRSTTAPKTMKNRVRVSPKTLANSLWTLAEVCPEFVIGYCFAKLAAIAFKS